MREIVDYAWVELSEFAKVKRVKSHAGNDISLHPLAADVIDIGRKKGWFN